jgi:outer membrane protein assembly factor BamB
MAGLAAFAVATAVWSVASSASASLLQTGGGDEWTQFQGGPQHTGFVPDGPSPAFVEAWRFAEPLGGPNGVTGLSAPVVAGDEVIVVGPQAVIGVGLGDGAERWRNPRDPGPPVTPAVGTTAGPPIVVYTEGFGPNPPGSESPTTSIASPSGPSPSGPVAPSASPADAPRTGGDAHAVALALRGDHAERWRVPLPSGSRTGVTIEGDTAYIGTNDGSVTAFELSTGDARWTANAGGFLDAPLAVSGGLVLVGVTGDEQTAYTLVALRTADGSEAWRYTPDTSAQIAGVPAIGDGMAFVGLVDQTLRAISLVDGAERWVARLNARVGLQGAPAIADDGVVAVDLLGQVYRLDWVTGERVWDHALNTSVPRSSPVVTDGSVLVAARDGELLAVEASSGDLVWRGAASANLLRTLAVSGELVLGVTGGSSPGLVAWRHDPAGALTRVVTPTKIDPARLLVGFIAGAIPVVAVLWLLGRLLAARFGAASEDSARGDESGFDGDEELDVAESETDGPGEISEARRDAEQERP